MIFIIVNLHIFASVNEVFKYYSNKNIINLNA
jgi:hypothetical protein